MKIFSKTRKRNQNSYLLLAMFFLIFLIKPEIIFSIDYSIEKIDTNISNRSEFGINDFFYDEDSTIWMNRHYALNCMKKGESKFTQYIHSKDVGNSIKLQYAMHNPHFDGFGNMVSIQAGEIAMIDMETKEYKYNKCLKELKEMSIFWGRGVQFGDIMFLNSSFYGSPKNYYLKYDKIQKNG